MATNETAERKYFYWRACALFVFWLFLTGQINAANVVLGLAVALTVTRFSHQIIIHRRERLALNLTNVLAMIHLLAIFLVEVVKANLQVARLVLQRRPNLQPALLCLPYQLKTSMGISVLSNMITLTPGTLSVSVDEQHLVIHTLTQEAADALMRSRIPQLLAKMEVLD